MNLVDLASGSMSLEFARDEQPIVMERLNALGDVQISDRATYATMRVAGIDLIYMNEWDEPCLISSTTAGAALLGRVMGWSEEPKRAFG